MKKTYILGAGFSKEINNDYPVLGDLTEIAYENLINKYKGNPILEHFHHLPKEITSNIESLLSYLSINWPWKDVVEKHLDLALYKALEEQIISVFRNIASKEIDNTYIEFVKIAAYRFYNIISLNYDTLVEEIATKNSLAKDCEYCGNEILIEDKYDEYKLLDDNENIRKTARKIWIKRKFLETVTDEEIDTVFEKLIYKIWTHTFPHDIKHMILKPGSGRKPTIIKLHGTLANEFTDKGTIEKVIPPTLDKTNYYSSIGVQNTWKSALRVLCELDELNIIGFSFPKTDISMIYLLQTALNKNQNMRINIINIESKQDAQKKYSEILPGMANTINFGFCGIDSPLKKYISTELLKQ